MLTPSGVYMINIIDAYESDERANEKAENEIDKLKTSESTDARKKKIRADAMASAYRYGGFVGAGSHRQENVQSRVYFRNRRRARQGLARDIRRRGVEPGAGPG